MNKIALNLINIAAIRFVGHGFEMNRKMAESYLIEEGVGLDDYDEGFESGLESIVPEHEMTDEKRINKAISLVEEYAKNINW